MISGAMTDAVTVARHVTPAITSASASSLPDNVHAAQTALESQRGMQPIYYVGAAILGLMVGTAVLKHMRPAPSPQLQKKK